MSYFEETSMVEASLGGKLSASELKVFGEDLIELIDGLGSRPFNLLLDYSRANNFSPEVHEELTFIRDECHVRGAVKIVSVTASETALDRESSQRIQFVMDGKEEYVLDPSYARFTPQAQDNYYLKVA